MLFPTAARLEALLAEGVTAIEIKSGYGLDLASERKMLRVARQLGERYPVTVYTTFLGAHALPPEFAGRADDYIDEVCNAMLPALAAEGRSTPSTCSASASVFRSSRRACIRRRGAPRAAGEDARGAAVE